MEYKCDQYCPIPCGEFDQDSENKTECIRAITNCDCRPFYKTPACWLISSLSAVVILSLLRLLILYIWNRKNKTKSSVDTRKDLDVNVRVSSGNSKKCDDLTLSDTFPPKSFKVGTDQTRKTVDNNLSTFTECD